MENVFDENKMLVHRWKAPKAYRLLKSKAVETVRKSLYKSKVGCSLIPYRNAMIFQVHGFLLKT